MQQSRFDLQMSESVMISSWPKIEMQIYADFLMGNYDYFKKNYLFCRIRNYNLYVWLILVYILTWYHSK